MLNRREFSMLSVLFGSGLIPISSFSNSAKPFLILIELSGANDGLNTVIPYSNDRYYGLRPNIAIHEKELLKLDDNQALHPSLGTMMNLYNRGSLKILQNVGYPNQIQSHFRSMEVWERGGDGRLNRQNGWLVDDIQTQLNNIYDANGIYLGGTRDIFAGGNAWFLGPDFHHSIRARKKIKQIDESNSRLNLLQQLTNKRKINSEILDLISKKFVNAQKMSVRGGKVGKQLKTVCNLLSAEIIFPVFKVKHGSFDTHIRQKSVHQKLLRDLDLAITDLVYNIKRIGLWDECLIMTYSEFGRRVRENGAQGTDHGTAAPHFLIGGHVTSGVFGGIPDLEHLTNNDLRFSIDFRAVYEAVLRNHFKLDKNSFSEFKRPELLFSA